MTIEQHIKEEMSEQVRRAFDDKVARDAVHAHVEVSFSFLDRIRILMHGKAHIKNVTYCENRPGCVSTDSKVSIPGLRSTLFKGKPCFGVAGPEGGSEQAVLEKHPFSEPSYFGEDGEWMAVRGDIPAEEAAKRLTDYDDMLTGEKREPILPSELSLGEAYLHGVDAEEGEDWRLHLSNELIRPNVRIVEVWTFDNY